jgi:hypothetical protein
MPSFVNNLYPNLPIGSTPANTLDTITRLDIKAALIERLALEHHNPATANTDTLAENAQGRHIAGKVGVLGVGSMADRNALTASGEGALFLIDNSEADPEANNLYRYSVTNGWELALWSQGMHFATQEQVDEGTRDDLGVSPLTLAGYLGHNPQYSGYLFTNVAVTAYAGTPAAFDLSPGLGNAAGSRCLVLLHAYGCASSESLYIKPDGDTIKPHPAASNAGWGCSAVLVETNNRGGYIYCITSETGKINLIGQNSAYTLQNLKVITYQVVAEA